MRSNYRKHKILAHLYEYHYKVKYDNESDKHFIFTNVNHNLNIPIRILDHLCYELSQEEEVAKMKRARVPIAKITEKGRSAYLNKKYLRKYWYDFVSFIKDLNVVFIFFVGFLSGILTTTKKINTKT